MIEVLENGVKVVVSKTHCFNTDSILLANFSMPKSKEKLVFDLGSGCGVIPFLWRDAGYKGKVFGVEIQKEAFELILESNRINEKKMSVGAINRDIRNLDEYKNECDLVVCNPPYKKIDSGLVSGKASRAIARSEILCGIFDFIYVASLLLKFSGRFCMCARTERLVDVVFNMRKNGIEPKRVEFIGSSQKSEAKLFLIEGKKGAKDGLVVSWRDGYAR